MNIIVKRPIVSEKTMKMASNGFYTFLVSRDARKPIIAKAIADQFKVDVVSIKTVNLKDEVRRQRSGKGYYTIAGCKKAIVSLKKGQKITLFETEEEKESQPEVQVKEKKSLLKGTKVKIEKSEKKAKK